MRTHGWAGDPPETDADATQRILDSVDHVVYEGVAVSIVEVARVLGVTRQTVYRYFPTTEDLLIAGARRQADTFVDELSRRLATCSTAKSVLVEGIAYTVDELPRRPFGRLLLDDRASRVYVDAMMSDAAQGRARSVLRGVAVDWASFGVATSSDFDSLAEFVVRAVHSFVAHPGTPPRHGSDLRSYLERWIVPGTVSPG